MTVLIDSNVLIDFLKGKHVVKEQIGKFTSKNIPIFISTISIYEVYTGIIANLYLKRGRPSKVPELLSAYEKFLLNCGILDFTRQAAEKAADIYAQSQGKGTMIKEKDCQIAGIGLVHGISIVFTRDEGDFSKIFEMTGLKYISYEDKR
ncbi:MAG: type II toxin-antitoxin system VapC family toxin [Candidatus Helarchaeota archaeon]